MGAGPHASTPHSSQVERLPDALQREHTIWLTRPRTSPTVEQMKERARALALSMLELGEDGEAVERQLHRWRFHPAVAHEALRWALDAHGRVGAAPTTTVAVASGPGRSMALSRPIPRPLPASIPHPSSMPVPPPPPATAGGALDRAG